MGRPKKPAEPRPSETIRARLMGIGGQRSDGSPNVRAIAQRLGKSERTVRRYLQEDRIPARAETTVRDVERAESHRPTWVTARDEGATGRAILGTRRMPPAQDVRGQLVMAYGRKDGSLDSARAARELGVSQRTVQRWASGSSRPKEQHQTQLRAGVRQAAAAGNKRVSRMENQGASVSFKATVSVSGDTRTRTVGNHRVQLTGSQMRQIRAAYERGGDAAADRELARQFSQTGYARGWLDSGGIKNVSDTSFK